MAWADRTDAVPNTFTGRPSPTNTDAAYQVRAAPVNENFQAGQLAVAICQALGTEVADNTSTTILCKLTLLAGRFAPGDRLTIIEDRPTLRTWCAVVGGSASVPTVEFDDGDLQDTALAGTSDYNAIKDDLILLAVGQGDNAIWPKQTILLGGAHGITGSDIPWKTGETDTIDDRLQAAAGPAGSDGEIQFNDSGDFGAEGAFKWLGSTVATLIASLSSTISAVIGSAIFGNGHTVVTGGDYILVAGKDHSVTADGDYGTALGHGTKLHRNHQVVNAGNLISTAGDAQHTLSLPRKLATTDATPTLIAAEPIEAGKSYVVTGKAVARTTAGVTRWWIFEGAVENTGGTTRLLAAITPTGAGDAGGSSWGLAVAANDTTDTLDITATGAGGTAINWMLALTMIEVGL